MGPDAQPSPPPPCGPSGFLQSLRHFSFVEGRGMKEGRERDTERCRPSPAVGPVPQDSPSPSAPLPPSPSPAHSEQGA